MASAKRSTGEKRVRSGGAGGESGDGSSTRGGKSAGASGKPEKRTERPRIQSSHGARKYAAKKAHVAAKPATRPDARKRAVKAPVTGLGPRTKKAKSAPSSAGTTSIASDDSRELAIAIAGAALEKKALALEVLDVAGKVDYADFLVLMSGRSDRQVSALAQGIDEALRKKNRRALSIEGLQQATWVLMDFGDVVVHIFQDDARSLYDIEGLWLDARRLPVPLPDDLR